MKKYLLMLLAMSMFSLNLVAQEPDSPEWAAQKAASAEGAAKTRVPGRKSTEEVFVPSATLTARTGCIIPRDGSWTQLALGDDNSSGQINLPFNFDLYGSSYNKVWVNNNGNLTFTGPTGQYSANGFPFSTPMVAAFWGDVDTRSCGGVYYKSFGTRFVVTFENVGYYSTQCNLRNTFQIVIGTTNDPVIGLGQNVLFNYGDMNWTTGSASGGSGGFGGTPATVGINHGNNVNYVQIGRFNLNNSSYDGGGGANDGVHYLDNQCFSFNVSTAGNIPPSFSGFPQGNTITVNCRDTFRLTIQSLPPEVNQSVSLSVNTNGMCNAFASVTNGAVATANLTIIPSACNAGTNTITFTATDNGTPSETAVATLTVIVESCNTPPVAVCQALTISADANCKGNVAASSFDGGSSDAEGDALTFSVSPAGPYALGVTNVTLTVTDANGASSSCSTTVTVTDNAAPSVACGTDQFFCYNGSNYTIPAVSASDNCSIASVSYEVTGATTRSGSGNDASGTFNVGVSNITWTVTDASGNSSSCTVSVTVNAPISAAIPDAYAVNPGGNANTIYTGYGPSTITLTAMGTGGSGSYTYQWSNGATTQTIAAGAGTYSVTVTDAAGCSATASTQIVTKDIRCGNKNDKVTVCHIPTGNTGNPQTLCIAASAVPAHLAHGCYLGACTNASKGAPAVVAATNEVTTVYPNPAKGAFDLQLADYAPGAYQVNVTDNYGRAIMQRSVTVDGKMQKVSIDMGKAAPGIYNVNITGNGKPRSARIVIRN